MTADIEDGPRIASINPKQVTTNHGHCRYCGNTNLTRIPRGRFVRRFLFWLPLKKYVCYRCHHKTYRWGNRQKG
ncbi:hypothetical protein [Mucilaginibacter pocheonensis]|uniref:Uncharacterized protein n=1 Tax=Mucilaginibacter pocheonensis TaxID=398050 RepID=A0ABU1TGT1_9SPHI|nr:hypothetical protein [Mucilaginibacter pocheonensis]MDR6944567.1 hypothetical protein [Mucilaginibacter pocheonensis]